MDPNDPAGRILVPVSSVKKIIDRTSPATPGAVYRASPEDIMLAAARMRRDGASREAIMKALEADTSVVTNDIMDRFLDRADALLNQRIAQGLEPAETRVVVQVPVDPGSAIGSVGPSQIGGMAVPKGLYAPDEDDEPGEPDR